MRFNWMFGCEGKDGAGGIGDITVLAAPPDIVMQSHKGLLRATSIVPIPVDRACDIMRHRVLRKHPVATMVRRHPELRQRILDSFATHADLVKHVVAERRAQHARFKSIQSDAEAFACIASLTAQACCITFDALSVQQHEAIRAQKGESK